MGIELATIGTIASIAGGLATAGTSIYSAIKGGPKTPDIPDSGFKSQPLSKDTGKNKNKLLNVPRSGVATSPLGDTSETTGTRAKLLGN